MADQWDQFKVQAPPATAPAPAGGDQWDQYKVQASSTPNQDAFAAMGRGALQGLKDFPASAASAVMQTTGLPQLWDFINGIRDLHQVATKHSPEAAEDLRQRVSSELGLDSASSIYNTIVHGTREQRDELIGNAATQALLTKGMLKMGTGLASSLPEWAQRYRAGVTNAADFSQWGPSFQKFADALGFGSNNVGAAKNLMKAAPLIKLEEANPRSLPSQSSLGGRPGPMPANVSPLANPPFVKNIPLTDVNRPYVSGAPDYLRLGDVLDATTNAKAKLWGQIQQWQDAHAANGTIVSARPMISALQNSGTEYSRLADPQGVNAAATRARQLYMRPVPTPVGGYTFIPRQLSVPQLFEYLRGINADLDVFEDKAPGNKQSLIDKGMSHAGLLAERSALQDTLYSLDQTGTIKDMMAHYGALTEFGDYAMAQMSASLAHDPSTLSKALPFITRAAAQAKLGEFRGATSNFSQGLTRAVIPVQGSGSKLADAFKNLKAPPPQWGAPTPPTPMATPPPVPPAGAAPGGAPTPPLRPAWPMPPPVGGPPMPMAQQVPPEWTPPPPTGIRVLPQGGGAPQLPPAPPKGLPAPPIQQGPANPTPTATMKGQTGKFTAPTGPAGGSALPIIDSDTGQIVGYDSKEMKSEAMPFRAETSDERINRTQRTQGGGISMPAGPPPPPQKLLNAGPPQDISLSEKMALQDADKGISPEKAPPQGAPVPPKRIPYTPGVREGLKEPWPGEPMFPWSERIGQSSQGMNFNPKNAFFNPSGVDTMAIGGIVRGGPPRLGGDPNAAKTAAKQHLYKSYAGLAKKNKGGGYGSPAGSLTDVQQAQYNHSLGQIDPDAVGKPVLVGEAGPERITHSDGRPPEVVNGPTMLPLGQNGPDKVTPLNPPPRGIIRGSSDVALSPEGRHEAQAMGHMIAANGGIDTVATSDLGRTQDTAKLVAAPSGAKILPPDSNMRSWAVGGLEGQPVTQQTDAELQRLIVAPDEVPQGSGPISTQPGESFNQFKTRAINTFRKLVAMHQSAPNSRLLAVTHNHDIKLIRGYLAAGMPPNGAIDNREMMKVGDKPGVLNKLGRDKNGRMVLADHDPSKQGMPPGLYFLRHAKTGWNSPPNSAERGS